MQERQQPPIHLENLGVRQPAAAYRAVVPEEILDRAVPAIAVPAIVTPKKINQSCMAWQAVSVSFKEVV